MCLHIKVVVAVFRCHACLQYESMVSALGPAHTVCHETWHMTQVTSYSDTYLVATASLYYTHRVLYLADTTLIIICLLQARSRD